MTPLVPSRRTRVWITLVTTVVVIVGVLAFVGNASGDPVHPPHVVRPAAASALSVRLISSPVPREPRDVHVYARQMSVKIAIFAAVYDAHARAAAVQAMHHPTYAVVYHPVVHHHHANTNSVTVAWSGGGGGGSFLTCVVQRESNGDPTAVNPSSGTGGLFQDMPGTWQNAAREINPKIAQQYPRAQYAPAGVQWQVNEHIYATQGRQPWGGGRYSC